MAERTVPHPDILELREIRKQYPEYDVEAVTLGIMGLTNDAIRTALRIARKHHVPSELLVGSIEALLKIKRDVPADPRPVGEVGSDG